MRAIAIAQTLLTCARPWIRTPTPSMAKNKNPRKKKPRIWFLCFYFIPTDAFRLGFHALLAFLLLVLVKGIVSQHCLMRLTVMHFIVFETCFEARLASLGIFLPQTPKCKHYWFVPPILGLVCSLDIHHPSSLPPWRKGREGWRTMGREWASRRGQDPISSSSCFLFESIYFYLMYMRVHLHICMCTMCVSLESLETKKVFISLEMDCCNDPL